MAEALAIRVSAILVPVCRGLRLSTTSDERRQAIYLVILRMLNGRLRLRTLFALLAVVLTWLTILAGLTWLAIFARLTGLSLLAWLLIWLSFARLILRLRLRLLSRHKPGFSAKV
jgi:hypothetical protein